jgi:hypothetical protein
MISISMPSTTRNLLVLAVLAAPLHAPTARGEEPDADAAALARVEAAVDRALEFLAAKQLPDGSWPQGVSPKPNTGVSGLCTLAFLGRGHVPGRGPYAKTVGLAVDGLRGSRRMDGLLVHPGGNSHGPMYEHALATLALIEASGWLTDPELRETCQEAVDIIVAAQNPEGGTNRGRRTPT